MSQIVLTDDMIRAEAPSVFATERHPKMGERYAFISTAQVLHALRAEGFQPVRAQQAGSRESARAGFTRHVITFRQADAPLIAGEHIPEIVLMNAHDGSAAYRLMVGCFRVVCSNGLIVAEKSLAAIRVAHVGTRTIAEVVAGTHKLVAALPAVLGQVEDWRSTMLPMEQRLAYARAALAIRYPDRPSPIEPQQLLGVRRLEDGSADLWITFNRVQEHLVRGGLRGQLPSGRKATTRPVQAVSTSMNLNRALWALTAETARHGFVPAELVSVER